MYPRIFSVHHAALSVDPPYLVICHALYMHRQGFLTSPFSCVIYPYQGARLIIIRSTKEALRLLRETLEKAYSGHNDVLRFHGYFTFTVRGFILPPLLCWLIPL